MESRKLLTHASYFAVTAAPKNKTLEIFGEPDPQPDGTVRRRACHSYTMKQAIQEGFILNVLEHYTPVASYYRLTKTVEDDPEFDTKKAQKKLRCFVEGHDHAIRLKAEIMVDHFHEQVLTRNKIGGAARAMVVANGIERAIQCFQAIRGYLAERKSLYRAIVAFSGEHLVELEVVDSISHEIVRQTLKNSIKSWLKECWCIPPKENEDFFAFAMEDVLKVYHRDFDDGTVLVCTDESSKQLTRETRAPLPTSPGQPAIYDFEYERNGTANLFMVHPPLAGWRHVEVTDRCTKLDFEHLLRDMADVHLPDRKIVLVMDNLNTHKLSALYKAFPADESSRLADRFEVHNTPKHGSWLNMAEIEIGVLSRQCLARRIPDRETLDRQIAFWQARRNAAATPVDWRFRTEDARVKMKTLYPTIPC